MATRSDDIHVDSVQSTYRYLRVSMPVLGVVLGAAVMRQIFQQEPHCWLGSISAYYYTSARAAFVASLCAIGAALIVYHGNSPREDVALNVSGFLAFVVAFVPTPLQGLTVVPGAVECGRSNVPTNDQLVRAIENNVFALLVGSTLVVALAWIFWRDASTEERVGTLDLRPLIVASAGVVVGWAMWGAGLDWVRQHAHLWSAIGLFAGIVLVILMNAWGPFRGSAPRPQPGYERIYRVVAIAMIAGFAILGVMALMHVLDHTVFWLESVGIIGFVVFWSVQTRELWDVAARGRKVETTPETGTVAPGGPRSR